MEKKKGKGKEYDYNGKLEFEGEFLNGERNGEGKEYYYNCKLMPNSMVSFYHYIHLTTLKF